MAAADIARAVLEQIRLADPCERFDVHAAAERMQLDAGERRSFVEAFDAAWQKLTGWRWDEPEARWLGAEVELVLQDLAGIERPAPVFVGDGQA